MQIIFYIYSKILKLCTKSKVKTLKNEQKFRLHLFCESFSSNLRQKIKKLFEKKFKPSFFSY
jgi:hypothetical protein